MMDTNKDARNPQGRTEILQAFSTGKISGIAAVNLLDLYDYAELVQVMAQAGLPLPPPPEPYNAKDFITLAEAFAMSDGC